MRQVILRSAGTLCLAALVASQYPTAAQAAFAPPAGGHGGATLSGVVIDPPRENRQPKEGDVIEGTDPNALWVIAGAGVALAILVNGNGSDTTPPLGDCGDLFDDLFNNGEAVRNGGCDERGAAALFAPLAMAAISVPDPAISLPGLEERLAQTLMPSAPAGTAIPSMYAAGHEALVRAGQPAGVDVTIGLDDYLMSGHVYDATFTVTATPGSDLSQPLFLTAADLAQAGEFIHQIGFPFAVPVDMDALRAHGSWTYTTPFKATGGAYYLDAYIGSHLPRTLIQNPDRGISIIDTLSRDLSSLNNKLARQSGNAGLTAKRDALQAHLVWLMEWNRQQ